MLIKLIAILAVLVGIAGLVLPVIPGVFLIIIGLLLFFKDRTADVRKFLPEKIPAVAAVLYNWFIPKLLLPHYKSIASEIALSGGKTILDIGTGPGVLPIEIARTFSNCKITGIDLSGKMIEIASKNKASRRWQGSRVQENVEFKIMDAKRLEFPSNTFDMVISTGSLHHWKEPVKVIDEIHRCLKPGSEAWIYDGYADAKDEDIDKSVRKILKIFPPNGFIRHMMHIHGYNKTGYETQISETIHQTRFKECVFEPRGIMMRIKLKKLTADS